MTKNSPLHKTAVLNVVGLTRSLIGENTPRLKKFLEENWNATLEEPFPAVTCTSQAVMLTGEPPAKNGIVGNGWYFHDLAEVGFWKQNNGLIQGEKVYQTLKKQNPSFTCAKLFWWYNMYADVDWSITPRPHYPADGRKVFDIYTEPAGLHDPIIKDLGEFPFFEFWGPGSGIGSSKWIANSAKWVFGKHQPDLNLVYLPHLDYCLQRFGPGAGEIAKELSAIDQIVGDLLDYYAEKNVRVIIVSEYGISKVARHIHPNRILRQAGLLSVRKSVDWELIDAGGSEAFAVSDHQICHIYVKDKSRIQEVAKLFEGEKKAGINSGHKAVLYGEAIAKAGLDHERSGDVILMAESDTWYTYYYWEDDKLAPDFARCIDIHRKPGYDPVELFFDPNIPAIKLKLAFTLLKKKLGFRYYMDVIPLKPELVKGSHGTPSENTDEKPLVISNFASQLVKSPAANRSNLSDAKQGETSMLPMSAIRDLIIDHVLNPN